MQLLIVLLVVKFAFASVGDIVSRDGLSVGDERSDLTLLVNRVEYKVHKSVLLQVDSDRLRELIEASKPGKGIKIQVPTIAYLEAETFRLFLAYVYTGNITLGAETLDRLLDLLGLLAHFEMDMQMRPVLAFLEQSIDVQNVAHIFTKAVLYELHDLVDGCAQYITRNSAQFLGANLMTSCLLGLSEESLKALLAEGVFDQEPEMRIYELIKEWHSFNNRSRAVSDELFGHLRPSLLSLAEISQLLVELRHTPVSTRIIDAIQERLSQLQLETTQQPSTPIATTTAPLVSTTMRSSSVFKSSRSTSIRAVPDGSSSGHSIMATSYHDRTNNQVGIRIWHMMQANYEHADHVNVTLLQTIETPEVYALEQLSANVMACGSIDHRVRVCNLESNECEQTSDEDKHTNVVLALKALTPTRFVSASADATTKVWDVNTRRCVSTLHGHTSAVLALEKIASNRLATGSYDHTVRIWNMDTFVCMRTLVGHEYSVNALKMINPTRLASASTDHTIRVWNLDNGEIARRLVGHAGAVLSLEFLSGKNQLVSGSDDNTIRVWNLYTGRCVRVIAEHINGVVALASFSRNWLVSASKGRDMVVWNVDGDKYGQLGKTGVQLAFSSGFFKTGLVHLETNAYDGFEAELH